MRVGGGARSGAGEGPKGDRGCRARAERTLNMSSMVVTLDVSKLSGRLKSTASCPVERRAFEAGGMRAGRWESVNGGACKRRRGSGWGSGGQGSGGAHLEHAVHGGDAGRVEAQRLVERRRILRCRG